MTEPITVRRVRSALFYGFLALLAWLTFLVFEPFLTPLAWAGVLVIVFYPTHRRLERRLGPTASAAISTLAVTAILIVPTVLIVIQFVHQALEAPGAIQMGPLQSWLNDHWARLAAHLPGQATSLASVVQQSSRQFATWLAGELGGVMRNVAIFLFDLVITIFAMFYFFRDAGSIMRWLREVLPFAEGQREEMIAQAHDLVFVTVGTTLAAAGLTGVIGGVAFLVVGMHNVVFWGVAMAFTSFVPFVGAWLIWVPAAVWLLVEGHVGRMIALLVICAIAIVIIDNVVRPLMISGQSALNGLLVLIGVLGGIVVFGLIGVVLGPIIIAIAGGRLYSYTRPGEVPGPPAGSVSVTPG